MGSKAPKIGCTPCGRSPEKFGGCEGRWDRNRTCNLRLWSSPRSVHCCWRASTGAEFCLLLPAGLSSCVRMCRRGLLSELLSITKRVSWESSWSVSVFPLEVNERSRRAITLAQWGQRKGARDAWPPSHSNECLPILRIQAPYCPTQRFLGCVPCQECPEGDCTFQMRSLKICVL